MIDKETLYGKDPETPQGRKDLLGVCLARRELAYIERYVNNKLLLSLRHERRGRTVALCLSAVTADGQLPIVDFKKSAKEPNRQLAIGNRQSAMISVCNFCRIKDSVHGVLVAFKVFALGSEHQVNHLQLARVFPIGLPVKPAMIIGLFGVRFAELDAF